MKRKAVLATVLGAAVAATAIPMVVSGTASAQSGSRLCGVYSVSPMTNETITQLYEIGKYDEIACSVAHEKHKLEESPFAPLLKDRAFDGYVDHTFSFEICEDWNDRPAPEGGLSGGGAARTFIHPDGSPLGDQFDICNNMERTDNILNDIELYWLYFDGSLLSSYVRVVHEDIGH